MFKKLCSFTMLCVLIFGISFAFVPRYDIEENLNLTKELDKWEPTIKDIASVSKKSSVTYDATNDVLSLLETSANKIGESAKKEKVADVSEPVTKNNISITEFEIQLIALITMAEAEGEPEYGQRLVIDTILNRVDSERFPNTVTEVVYQKNQYECVTNGRVDRCYVKDDILQLVREEIKNRTNSDVIFFRTKHYSPYGTPMFRECCHYFSSL